jgi:peptidoglycan/LPS O-acetylase OafA/YrhL
MYMTGDLWETLTNLLLFFPFMESPRLTPPAWALTVEIFFYILIGLGLSKNRRITLAWFLISVNYHIGALMLRVAVDYRYFPVFAASLPFSTGALIFHHRDRLAQSVRDLPGAAAPHLPVLAFSAVVANCVLAILSGYADGILFYTNYLLCALMVVVLIDRKTLPFITKRLDSWLGDLSYPTYLMHLQVGMLVLLLFSAAGVDVSRPNLLLMTASIPAVLVCAWIISVCLERPIELIRSKVKG